MKRLINALRNSMRALLHLLRHEKAFQQEMVVLILAIPAAFFISSDWLGRVILIGSIIFVMIVEILNTAIEATCNALSREFNPDIKIAKDLGSLAVLLAIMLALLIWICFIFA